MWRHYKSWDTTSRESHVLCLITHLSFIFHASLIHAWLIHVSHMPHPHVTCLIDMLHDVTWPIDKRHDICAPHTPPTYATHDTCLTRRLHTPHMSPSHVAHLLQTSHMTHASFTCHMSHTSHTPLSHVTCLFHMWHDSLTRDTVHPDVMWLLDASHDLLPLHMWHDTCLTRLLHTPHYSRFICDMPHSNVY